MFFSTLAVALIAAARGVSAANCSPYTWGVCEDGLTHWYDPDDGQICDLLDCGGGRAPVKYDVPCCAAYTGTEPCISTTRYMSCPGVGAAAATTPPEPAPTPIVEVPTSPAGDITPPAATTTQTLPFSSSPSSTTPTMTVTSTTSSSSSTGANTSTITSGTSRSNTTSTTTRATSSSTTSSAQVISPTNAADHLQYGSLIALAGAVMGAAIL